MAEYRVYYTYIEEDYVDVEAESEDEAVNFAQDETFHDITEITDVFQR